MRTSRPLIGLALLAAVLTLGGVACDDGNGGEGPAATATQEGGTETPADGGGPVSITLEEVGGSGVTGSVAITETEAGGAEVVVTIDGGLEPGSHVSQVHHGTCDAQGEVYVPLTNLEAGPDGSAAATTIIGHFSHLLQRGHFVAVQALDGTVVACGNLGPASS